MTPIEFRNLVDSLIREHGKENVITTIESILNFYKENETKHYYTYWFEVTDEESDYCGEEFFTELETSDKETHIAYARQIFPGTELRCLGRVSEMEAEMMGLDTY